MEGVDIFLGLLSGSVPLMDTVDSIIEKYKDDHDSFIAEIRKMRPDAAFYVMQQIVKSGADGDDFMVKIFKDKPEFELEVRDMILNTIKGRKP